MIGVDLQGAEVVADLSTPDGRKRAVEAVLAESNGGLDRLVACAGLGSHLTDLPLIVSVNYFGAVDVLDGLREALRVGTRRAVVVLGREDGFLERSEVRIPIPDKLGAVAKALWRSGPSPSWTSSSPV